MRLRNLAGDTATLVILRHSDETRSTRILEIENQLESNQSMIARPLLACGLLLLCLCLSLVGCVAAPAYEGPATEHFDGRVFRNTVPSDKSPWDLMRLAWGTLTNAEAWPDHVANTSASVPPERYDQGMLVTYINHSTVLIQVQSINILTDPIYAERASPFSWIGPKRVRDPGVAFDDLPPIDVILISHNHYDHLDKDTLMRIAERQAEPPLILAGLGNGAYFAELGLPTFQDMDWNDRVEHAGLSFHFVECRHRSGRGLSDQMRTLWGSFVIETEAGRIYFAGDTGYGPHFKEQGARFGKFALSILPIGAYEPRWFMADVHLDPAQAVQAHLDLNSRRSLGMHFGVFQLTYEGIDDPIVELEEALRVAELDQDVFWVFEPGAAGKPDVGY